MNWIKTNWTILAALVTMIVAWGDQVRRVNNVEEAIVDQARDHRGEAALLLAQSLAH